MERNEGRLSTLMMKIKIIDETAHELQRIGLLHKQNRFSESDVTQAVEALGRMVAAIDSPRL